MKILPATVKGTITQYYNACKPTIKDRIYAQTDKGQKKKEELYNKTIALLDNYATFMNKDDWSELMPKFWELNSKLDNIREEKFRDMIPDLYELIKHTKPK